MSPAAERKAVEWPRRRTRDVRPKDKYTAAAGRHQRRVIPRAPALAELLGQRDDDALGPADVGQSVRVPVRRYSSHGERRGAGDVVVSGGAVAEGGQVGQSR